MEKHHNPRATEGESIYIKCQELTVNSPEIDFNEYQIHRGKSTTFFFINLTYRKYLTPPYLKITIKLYSCD